MEKSQVFLKDALNLPNFLTLLRVLAIPLVLVWLLDGGPVANFWAAIAYTLATITDALDGWLARRQNLNSIVGKFLDPLADKLIVMAILIALVEMARIPGWIVILVLAREFSVTTLRLIAVGEGLVIAAGQGGKEKTALQMVALLLLILHRPFHIDYGIFSLDVNMNAAGFALLCISLVLALTSAGEYAALFKRAIDMKA